MVAILRTRYGILKEIPGKLYNNRFLVPEELFPEGVAIFPIVDIEELQKRLLNTESDHEVRAQGFCVSWKQGDADFMQIFGHRVATIAEMERIMPSGEGKEAGYYYLCYRPPLQSKDRKFLITDSFDATTELLGWGYESARHLPYAHRRAMAATYQLADNFGCELAARLDRPIIAILPKHIRFLLWNELYYGPDLSPKPFSREQIEQIQAMKRE